MTATLDGRPPGLNAFFHPGAEFTFDLSWPPGELDGRMFTAALGTADVDVAVVGDVMTLTLAAVDAAAAPVGGKFVLTDTTGGGAYPVVIGKWDPSSMARTSASATVEVAATSGAVAVTVIGASNAQVAAVAGRVDTVEGDLTDLDGRVGGTESALAATEFTVTDNAVIPGVIRTGTFGAPATFGGIEREARYWGAGEMLSPTGQINFGDGIPRVDMPAGVRTDVYAIVEIEEWWLDHTIGCYMEWSNDHDSTGNVRWECTVTQHDIATQAMATGHVLATRTFTQGIPAGSSTTSIIARDDGTHPVCDLSAPGPGPFASFYVFRYSRLGADPLDTLEGSVGFIAGNMTRGQ